MSLFLFFTIPLFGHVNYGLKIAKSLMDYGHECYYFSGEAFKEMVEQKGVSFHRYSDEIEDMFKNEKTSYNNKKTSIEPTKIDYLDEIWGLTIHSYEIMKCMAENDINMISELKPDCIVYDGIAIWGRWIADKLSIPCFCSCTSYFYSINMIEAHPDEVAEWFFKDYGLNGKSVLSMLYKFNKKIRQKYRDFPDYPILMNSSGSGDYNFIYSVKEFQLHPELIAQDTNYFVGIITDDDDFSENVDCYLSKDKKNIYIALGTIFNNRTLYNMCVEALKDSSENIIMSIGQSNEKEDILNVPDNWRIEKSFPQINLLNGIDVFISHGGTNSVREAATAGVPMVVIPQAGDQVFAARDVETLHVGCVLQDNITPQKIKEAVDQCLNSLEIKRSCEDLSRLMKKCVGLNGVVHIIEDKINSENKKRKVSASI